jgi:chromosome segregation ATPase
MKIKVVIIILALASLGLGIALLLTKKQADEQHASDVTSITEYSNQVVDAHEHLKEAGQVNLTLSNDLASSQQQLTLSADQTAQLSNRLAATSTTLAETKTSLDETRTSLASAQELVTNLNTRVADLEARNKQLDQQAEALHLSLAQLTEQIESTKNQLAVTKTNAAFLQGELQKQLAQKAELEHKFNDLDELRGQVKKMKDEIFIARRREWMKSDTGKRKGAELLMRYGAPATGSSPRKLPGTNYDLKVEIGSDGTARVIPPPGRTNNPAH